MEENCARCWSLLGDYRLPLISECLHRACRQSSGHNGLAVSTGKRRRAKISIEFFSRAILKKLGTGCVGTLTIQTPLSQSPNPPKCRLHGLQFFLLIHSKSSVGVRGRFTDIGKMHNYSAGLMKLPRGYTSAHTGRPWILSCTFSVSITKRPPTASAYGTHLPVMALIKCSCEGNVITPTNWPPDCVVTSSKASYHWLIHK